MDDENRNEFNDSINNTDDENSRNETLSDETTDDAVEVDESEGLNVDEKDTYSAQNTFAGNNQTTSNNGYGYQNQNPNPNYYNGGNQYSNNYSQNRPNNGYNPNNNYQRPNINPNDVHQPNRPEFNVNSVPGRNGYNNQPPQNNSNGTKKKKTGLIVFIVILCVVVVLAAAVAVKQFVGKSKSDNGDNTTVETVTTIDGKDSIKISPDSSVKSTNATEVYEKAKKYNVGILIYSNGSLYTEGSGVLAKESDDGKYTYIITCAHVINYPGVDITVLDENGKEYPAESVGVDTRTDIGVVRIKEVGLDLATFGSADKLTVGQQVYAIGNPGGSEFFGSFTNGMISAIARPISSSTGYVRKCIQHTAAINPGNSGGALVNDKGEVIGINSMKIASTEYEGMGFAVPSDVAVEVFNSIVKNGYVAGRSKLGIKYTTPSQYSQSYAMYVQVKGLPAGSVVIAQIDEDSELSGKDVKAGDIITEIDGKKLADTESLAAAMEGKKVGDTITLTIVRINSSNWSQTEQKITVKLVEDKGVSEEATTQRQSSDSDDIYEYFKRYFEGNGNGSSGNNPFSSQP